MNEKSMKLLRDMEFYEIDYKKSFKKQVSRGDILISTTMYLFDGYDRDIELNTKKFTKEIKNGFKKFIVTVVDGQFIKLNFEEDDEDSFVPEGQIFIRKQEIEYVTMSIPSFLVDKVKRLGGVIK